MSRENIEVDSLTELYAGANWMERETFDFYGIKFKGHPDLRPILNMEDLGYHPMLKNIALKMVQEPIRTMQCSEDKNNAVSSKQ